METQLKKPRCKKLDAFTIGEVAKILYMDRCTAEHFNKLNAFEIGVGDMTNIGATINTAKELHKLGLKPHLGEDKNISQLSMALREADAVEIGFEYAKLANIPFSSAEANTVKEIIYFKGQAGGYAVLFNAKSLLINCEALYSLNKEHDVGVLITNPGMTKLYWPSIQQTLDMIGRASDPEESRDLGFKLGRNFRFSLGCRIRKPHFAITKLMHERNRLGDSMSISTKVELPEHIGEFVITREDYSKAVMVHGPEVVKKYAVKALHSVTDASSELRCVGLKEFDPIPLPSKDLPNFYRSATEALDEFIKDSLRNRICNNAL